MGRLCSICTAPSRVAIDTLLVEGRTLNAIAKEFHTTKSSLSRHRQHIGEALSSAIERRRQKKNAEGDHLLERFEDLFQRATKLLDDAEANNSQAIAVSTIRELRGILNSIGTFSGKLPSQTVNIAVVFETKEWAQLRLRLMNALADEPTARAKVIQAFIGQPLALPVPEKDEIEVLRE